MKRRPRVVLICMFEPEHGPSGEFGLFRIRENMRQVPLPGLESVWETEDGQLMALVAGVGTANTAIALMALGLSDAVDLTEAYWLVAGIAGGNPQVCSLGSPVWADWCVDGDLAFELDSRDIPAEWPCGILPLGAKEPFGASSMDPGLFGHPYQVFALPRSLCRRALQLTQSISLADAPGLAALRQGYTVIPAAAEPPSVQLGGTLSGARFWHGPRHNAWAEHWVAHWTNGRGRFFTSAMEDTGTLHALAQLARMGRANTSRALILRTVSNFTMPPEGGDIVASLTADSHGGEFPAHAIALENSFRAASTVYRDILQNPKAWEIED